MFINLCMSEPFYIEKEFFVGGYFVTFNLITKTCKFKVMKFDLDLFTLIDKKEIYNTFLRFISYQ